MKIIELPYKTSNFYRNFHKLPGFVLLDSANVGRYDILSAYPEFTYIADLQSFNVEELHNLFSKYYIKDENIDLPFIGGFIGFFSYNLGNILQNITKDIVNQLTLPLIHLAYYDWALIKDRVLKKVYLVNASKYVKTKDICDEIRSKWMQDLCEIEDFKKTSDFVSNTSVDEYKEKFAGINQELRNGRTYQINYTQQFCASYEGSLWTLFETLRAKNPMPFSAYITLENASLLSLSPERFLSCKNRILTTEPIKGTVARNKNKYLDNLNQHWLLTSVKNYAEHIMIVDLSRNDLGRICKKDTIKVVKKCSLEKFPGLYHLISTIQGELLENITPLQAFLSMFPGGSITGAPKHEAMRMIAEYESYCREIYCGSIGYFSNNSNFDMNIAIRTIQATNNTIRLAVGGGIVFDSNWQDEYAEAYSKMQKIVASMEELA